MSKAQTFGMTDYMRSVNPPSYFHDGWLRSWLLTCLRYCTVKKVAYDSGLGWFIWVISPDKYVEIYQEGFNNKSDIYVKTGQKIGKLTGSHLHLGLTKTTKKYINKK